MRKKLQRVLIYDTLGPLLKEKKHCLFTCTTHGEGTSALFVDAVDTVVTAHFKQLTATPRGERHGNAPLNQ